MLPDYSYYIDEYHGNQIPEPDFPRLIARAGAYLARAVCGSPDPDNYKMAACAVAEAWQTNEQGGDLASQSVGSWSRSYADRKPKSDNQRLLEAAQLYLGSCVGAVRWA
ncbi:head-tail connector protein [Candidatus Darwinibacter acetoxidans]|jgi:hypothetical protein